MQIKDQGIFAGLLFGNEGEYVQFTQQVAELLTAAKLEQVLDAQRPQIERPLIQKLVDGLLYLFLDDFDIAYFKPPDANSPAKITQRSSDVKCQVIILQ